MNEATILNVETSGDVCSVCLSHGKKILGTLETHIPNSHAQNIALYVDTLFKKHHLTAQSLNAVSVSCGPGSYTGLRIGVSLAKAICYSWAVPLICISTLEAMFYGIRSAISEAEILFCPMIDARRMEVYTAVFDANGNKLLHEQPMILHKNSFKEYNINQMIFYGTGAQKFKTLNQDIQLVNFQSSATHLITLAVKKYYEKIFEDVAYAEPNYIKPFYSVTK